MRNVDLLDAPAIYRCASEGDPAALRIVNKASQGLARAIHWLVMGYDVEKVILGGGVSHEGQAFLMPILAELERMRSVSDLATILLPKNKVSLLPADMNVGTWGAIALAHEMLSQIYPSDVAVYS